MSDKIYGIKAALAVFESAGAGMTRQNFWQSIMPHFEKSGFAEKLGGALWVFDLRHTQHWALYVAEVRKRRDAGALPGNYEFSEFDMQNFTDGAWDN